MPSIVITTDGTVEGTKLTADGKDITKKEKVVSIDMFASAPYVSKYSGDKYPGSVGISYTVSGEDGTVSRKTLMTGDSNAPAGIGQKVKTEDQIIQFMGADVPASINNITDAIIEHCDENNLPCPKREVLLARSEASLRDKAEDLGIDLEDASKKKQNTTQ